MPNNSCGHPSLKELCEKLGSLPHDLQAEDYKRLLEGGSLPGRVFSVWDGQCTLSVCYLLAAMWTCWLRDVWLTIRHRAYDFANCPIDFWWGTSWIFDNDLALDLYRLRASCDDHGMISWNTTMIIRGMNSMIVLETNLFNITRAPLLQWSSSLRHRMVAICYGQKVG